MKQNKPIIGIMSYSKYLDTEDSFMDTYSVANNYTHKINKLGGCAIGIVMDNDALILETLDLCDGFIIQGGGKIRKPYLELIDYAINNDKPLLGICMGMQAIGLYSYLKKNQEEKIIEANPNSIHWPKDITREEINFLAHDISIKHNTLLKKILKKDKLKVNSFHNYHITKVESNFIASAFSDDNMIEAIELKDSNKFVLGVQWHPEIMNTTDELFKYFLKISKEKRQNNE